MRDKVIKFLKESWDLVLYGVLLVLIGMSVHIGYEFYFTRDVEFGRYDLVESFCNGERNSIPSDITVTIHGDSLFHIRNNEVNHSYFFNLKNEVGYENGYFIIAGATDRLFINPSEGRIIVKSGNGCVYGLSSTKSTQFNGRAVPERERREKPQKRVRPATERIQRAQLDVSTSLRERG